MHALLLKSIAVVGYNGSQDATSLRDVCSAGERAQSQRRKHDCPTSSGNEVPQQCLISSVQSVNEWVNLEGHARAAFNRTEHHPYPGKMRNLTAAH